MNRCMDGYISGQTQGSAPTTPFAFNCPDAVVVVGQVAHFNLTPEASLCRGFYLLPFVLSKGWRAQMETCGQIACTVRRLPIRFTVGTGGTIR